MGGLDDVRRVLKETLELPSRYAKLFENVPLKLRSGYRVYSFRIEYDRFETTCPTVFVARI